MGDDGDEYRGGVLASDPIIDEQLLEVLACPLDPERPSLELVGDHLHCPKCGARFPIVNGIPHLLPESAIMPETEESEEIE